jgi:hypothetical protein
MSLLRPRSRALPLTLAGVLAVVAGLAGPLVADDSKTSKRAAGDGRGLATFGDRGLTTFGDRFGQSFADRGLTTFADTPLTPMGGLIPGGVSVATDGSDPSVRHHSNGSSASTSRRVSWSDSSSWRTAIDSQASLGAGFSVDVDEGGDRVLLMPRVELPVVVLDHRPALAVLDATLDAAIRRAAATGDVDLVRSLDADRR